MALGQLDLAIELIDTAGEDASQEKAVHDTRKALKRLRALLGLLAEELGDAAFEREDATLREVAQRLSGARDAQVMLNTLDTLIERHPRKLGRGGVAKLRRNLKAEHARMRRRALGDPQTRSEVLCELRALRCRVAAWRLPEQGGIELIERDLTSLYRQGRRRHRRLASRKGLHTNAMHRWRKRVKDLRYTAEMLERRGSASTAGKSAGRRSRQRAEQDARWLHSVATRADDLGELLGEDHDLAVFAQRLVTAQRRGKGHTWQVRRRTRKTLLGLIAKRRRQLRKRALRDGRRLYATKPRRFVRRVRRTYAGGARLS